MPPQSLPNDHQPSSFCFETETVSFEAQSSAIHSVVGFIRRLSVVVNDYKDRAATTTAGDSRAATTNVQIALIP